jgi:REP element-mobilizing transposase RayT
MRRSVSGLFVTICAFQRKCLFGEIMDGYLRLNDMGVLVRDEWMKTSALLQNVCLDEFVVMPNHFHGIVNIVGAHCMRPIAHDMGMDEKRVHVGMAEKRAHISAPIRRHSGSIGSILAGFKSATTRQINLMRNNPGCPVWQRNYYERVIRNENELAGVREYIASNPMKWALDKESPANT